MKKANQKAMNNAVQKRKNRPLLEVRTNLHVHQGRLGRLRVGRN